jgi:hypothetical protein
MAASYLPAGCDALGNDMSILKSWWFCLLAGLVVGYLLAGYLGKSSGN